MKLVGIAVALALVGCGKSDKDKALDRAKDEVKADVKAALEKEQAAAKQGEPLPELSPNAPKDKPTTMGGTAEQEAKIATLQEEAKKTYPAAKARYQKGLPKGENFFVTTMLTSGARKESVFISVNKIEGTTVHGTIASDIMSVTGYKAGQAYDFDEAAITDWLITKPDGSEEGNLVGKYLDTIH